MWQLLAALLHPKQKGNLDRDGASHIHQPFQSPSAPGWKVVVELWARCEGPLGFLTLAFFSKQNGALSLNRLWTLSDSKQLKSNGANSCVIRPESKENPQSHGPP